MGARGKKRRRADGSIAGKRVQTHFGRTPHPEYVEHEPVPVDALASALAICWQHRPSDGSPMGDWDIEDQFDEIDRLAERERVDGSSLGTRADKLADLLTKAVGAPLYTLNGDTPVVDKALLEFAASSPVDDSDKPLAWPPSSGD